MLICRHYAITAVADTLSQLLPLRQCRHITPRMLRHSLLLAMTLIGLRRRQLHYAMPLAIDTYGFSR